MVFINNGTKVVINEQDYDYKELLEALVKKSGLDIINLLMENGIFIPRAMNMIALREVLDPKVKKARLLDLSDEVLYRLRFYPSFTEFQLINFYLAANCNADDFKKYLKVLYDRILVNAGLLNISDEIVLKLLALEDGECGFEEFEARIFKMTLDYRTYFDGVRIENLQDTLIKSATTQELRELGARYDIDIPKRLRRNQMQKLIEVELKKQGKLDEDLANRLDKMPVLTLQRLAKNNNIRVSADLKKEDVIEYLVNSISKAELEHIKKADFIGLETKFEFKLSYVDITEGNQPKKESNDNRDDVLNELLSEMKKANDAPQVEVQDNSETNSLLKDLITEMKDNKPEAQVVNQTSVDSDTKELLKELVLAVKESKTSSDNETKDLIKELISELRASRTNATVALEEKKSEITDNPYTFDNFTEQVNPKYDESIADKMFIADKEAILPDYNEEADTLNEVKLDSKGKKEAKLEAKAEKKEAKARRKEEARLEKLEAKALRKADRHRSKSDKKEDEANRKASKQHQRELEALLRSGRLNEVPSEELDSFMRIKTLELRIKEEKQAKHDRKLHRIDSVFKTILLFVLILVLVWLVFALLFSKGISLEVKQFFDEHGMSWLFGGITDFIKNFIQK